MILRCRWFAAGLAVVVALHLHAPLGAKISTWKDVTGATLKGEPTEILGPFVVFRTSGNGGRRVLLRAFSREDCVRIHEEIGGRPAKASRFADAKAYATAGLVGRVQRAVDGKLVDADLTRQPEPELLLVLAGSHNSAEGWFMVGNLHEFYRRVQRVYPDRLEAVFLGARHDLGQHHNIALAGPMPWLVAELGQQPSLGALRSFIPQVEGANLVLVSRHGVPLVAQRGGDNEGVQLFVDQVSELLWQIDPANAAGWTDRLHYLTATRPVEFAQAETGPLLVGDPLRPEVLRRYGVKRVEARLEIAADGRVVPTLLSVPPDVPADLAAGLTAALSKAVVAPAIRRGLPVAGQLDYRLEIPPADPQRERERTWLSSTAYPRVEIPEWLVLRPIKVSEQDFENTIVGENPDGTVILNALEVNTGKISRRAQMSAFNSDWFGEAGPGAVRPREGERQRIDAETELTWERVRAQNGFVNMQSGILRDYTVGYAWAEVESPRDTEAWLGLGSDDGIKIWLNGELVHDKWIRRPSRVDDDIIPLRLRKGPNQILIKIQNATIDWSFLYRLRLKP